MDNILRPQILAKKLGVSISSLYDIMKEPDFPPKVKMSKNRVGFRESQIEEWIEKKTQTETV